MEIPMLRRVESILIVTCCLIVASAITIPKENSEGTVQVPRLHYLSEDSSNEDTWNHDYPRFSMAVQERFQEAKRKSSFFPVRGKKFESNIHFLDGKPLPESFHDFSHNSRGDDQRSPLSPPYSLENLGNEFEVMDPLKWTTAQKRPSSFMPMRGRKRHLDLDNVKVLEQYLSSRARDGILDPVYESISLHRRSMSNGNRNVDTDQSDRANYPNFYDKSTKGEVNFLDRNQIEKHLKFITDAPSIEEIENGDIASNPKFFFPAKRALSFVPTRGRRENPDKFESEFTMPHAVVGLSNGFPTDYRASNISRYPYQDGGRSHERYRRASAFMPMRGRKSLMIPYELSAYNSLRTDPPRHDLVRRLDNARRINSLSDTKQELADVNDIGSQSQKRNFDGTNVHPSFTRQNLRTALVMKRPLSFFAARGKRLNV